MSTDQLNRTRPPEPPQPERARLDLSFSKIMGGALAAMTAAALGSRLSVAGTVIGAALASVIAAIAGAIYTASLQRTREKVRTVFTGRVAGSDTAARVDVVPESGTTATQVVGSLDPVTQVPVWDLPVEPTTPRPERRRLPWKNIVIGAAAAFALAFAAVTGIELITGHALSGGDGTTITQVTEPRSPTTGEPSTSTRPEPSASPSNEPSTTPSASASASDEPSTSAPAETEPKPSASGSTSSQPSQTSTPTPSASASASAPIPSASSR